MSLRRVLEVWFSKDDGREGIGWWMGTWGRSLGAVMAREVMCLRTCRASHSAFLLPDHLFRLFSFSLSFSLWFWLCCSFSSRPLLFSTPLLVPFCLFAASKYSSRASIPNQQWVLYRRITTVSSSRASILLESHPGWNSEEPLSQWRLEPVPARTRACNLRGKSGCIKCLMVPFQVHDDRVRHA